MGVRINSNVEVGKMKPRKSLPKNETKAQKFIRLGSLRTAKALKSVRLLGSLASVSYEYQDDQIKKIVGALREEISAVEKRFAGRGPVQSDFTL